MKITIYIVVTTVIIILVAKNFVSKTNESHFKKQNGQNAENNRIKSNERKRKGRHTSGLSMIHERAFISICTHIY